MSDSDGPSPAERYAAARARTATVASAHVRFRSLLEFELDPFQVEACRALEDGASVLVAAPTGAGKTVVGEFAVHLALEQGTKCFYTTPIKALSNQKFADLIRVHGADRVGLLTGDNAINGGADVVVMTTEVLRNMLYTGSGALTGLGFVVMDEVHYLADRSRGAVWEEVIIHLSESVRLVSLSATVSNAEEFGDWLATVRGETRVVVEETRPVPLWQHVMVGPRLYDLFVASSPQRRSGGRAEGRTTDAEEPPGPRAHVSPELLSVTRDAKRWSEDASRRRRDGRYPRRQSAGVYTPRRVEVIERLDSAGLLPAITFIFSRAGCDAAVEQLRRSGIRLVTSEERAEIRAYAQQRCASIPSEELLVLGYDEWLNGLERGVAAHHAGLLPTFKEIVEELFVRGLVRAVFATETLALGINMPARSVVLERLVKWNGDAHAEVTPGEYTQLTGRAGRRGIDVEGHAVVLWQPDLDVTAVAGLASTRTYPLRSSFRPSYNMAVNLIRQYGAERSRALLELSFAQFQADRAVVGLVKQVRRSEEALAGYREAVTCHLGDFEEYARLRRELSDREKRMSRERGAADRVAVITSLERLRPGDVVDVPAGRRVGIAVIIEPGLSGRDGPRPLVLTEQRQVKRLSLVDFTVPVATLGRVRIPPTFDGRSAQSRRDLASTLRAKGFGSASARRPRGGHDEDDGVRAAPNGSRPDTDAEVARLRREIRTHPCHGCADREDHSRWAERHWRLRKETDALRGRAEGRTHTIARQFDRVSDVLRDLRYLVGTEEVTPDGERLGRIYSELDLLAAECIRDGLWDGLTPPELASAVSALVYESRRPAEEAGAPQLPPGRVREVLDATMRRWSDLDEIEHRHGLDFLRQPDLGFALEAYRWASGDGLGAVLAASDRTPGDFVRWARQLVDLLSQVANAAPDAALRTAARRAQDAVHRGVVVSKTG